jgi:hypothetical protein
MTRYAATLAQQRVLIRAHAFLLAILVGRHVSITAGVLLTTRVNIRLARVGRLRWTLLRHWLGSLPSTLVDSEAASRLHRDHQGELA